LGKVDFESKKFHRPDLAIEHGLNLLTALAKTYHVPILVAAHLKAGEGASKYSTPSLNDFAQTAYIGRDARAAIGLFRDKKIADALHVAVLKQTNGISDVVFTLRTKNGSGLVENKSDEMVVDPYADTEREMMRRTQRAVYAVNPDDEATAWTSAEMAELDCLEMLACLNDEGRTKEFLAFQSTTIRGLLRQMHTELRRNEGFNADEILALESRVADAYRAFAARLASVS
jgi:hypothetical protein